MPRGTPLDAQRASNTRSAAMAPPETMRRGERKVLLPFRRSLATLLCITRFMHRRVKVPVNHGDRCADRQGDSLRCHRVALPRRLSCGISIPQRARGEQFIRRTALELTTLASPNFSERQPKILVLHYTVLSLDEVFEIFTGGHVSSHYTVDRDGSIYQHVDEGAAAHHAGISFWHLSSLNQSSIGIEIVNRGHTDVWAADGKVEKYWEPFTEIQISKVALLGLDIVRRYQIDPFDVIGHADIAPQRKEDPGLAFPWLALARLGLGVAYDAEQGLLVHGQESYSLPARQAEQCAIDVTSLQSKLARAAKSVPGFFVSARTVAANALASSSERFAAAPVALRAPL
ncbi:MAG: N-acetylmuramoyl-L-alanine amidase [Oxalobacteraceae bacterium]|nr:MAG: N-acetylmuramoyl-L-alanine amidase [Oxalobacteraceae bacterium]